VGEIGRHTITQRVAGDKTPHPSLQWVAETPSLVLKVLFRALDGRTALWATLCGWPAGERTPADRAYTIRAETRL
jgi:hypothetical protein